MNPRASEQVPGALVPEPESPPVLPVLVVGCGNLLRGDDALGPTLIRALWERGVPAGVELVDGGTAGLDVAFKMRGRRKVVVVDAARTGALPGTVFRVPGSELAELPAVTGLHQHAFRWDHALAVGRWLLKDDYPAEVVVVLVEIERTTPGAPLSDAAAAGLERALAVVRDEVVVGGIRRPVGAATPGVADPPDPPGVAEPPNPPDPAGVADLPEPSE